MQMYTGKGYRSQRKRKRKKEKIWVKEQGSLLLGCVFHCLWVSGYPFANSEVLNCSPEEEGGGQLRRGYNLLLMSEQLSERPCNYWPHHRLGTRL